MRGAASLSSSMSFDATSVPKKDQPVTLLLGRARLVVTPSAIASPELPMTMGMDVVARVEASRACVPDTTITSTFRATSCAARAGSRS